LSTETWAMVRTATSTSPKLTVGMGAPWLWGTAAGSAGGCGRPVPDGLTLERARPD
jgi:hypothetical protein